jgi:hypothetical protein
MKRPCCAAGLLAVAAVSLSAQRGPLGGIVTLRFDDYTGFHSIFDGKTTNGWDADPAFWRVENGELIGETAAQKQPKQNTFAIWRGAEPADFELKAEYRITGGNSGIQYRSVELPEIGKWVMKGYQADIDAANRYTGQVYEERGRGFLALRGQFTHIAAGDKPKLVGSLGEDLQAFIKNDWNQMHLIIRGNTLVQILNGHVMSVLIDDDTRNRSMRGLIGLQLHTGEPMKVEFRNLWLKQR